MEKYLGSKISGSSEQLSKRGIIIIPNLQKSKWRRQEIQCHVADPVARKNNVSLEEMHSEF